MNLSKQPPTDKPADRESSLIEWFLDDFVPRFGKQTLYVVGAIVVVVMGAVWFKGSRDSQQAKENKELGRAYIFYSEEKLDSAQAILSAFVKGSHSRLVQDKANLMLGQIHYGKRAYDEAIKAYGQVDAASGQSLISSGALHGLAAAYIEKKDFAKAAENLEKFLARFMRKTGAPSENLAGKEVVDPSPAVPNALWKLALCYRELKNPEKMKATAEKLVKVYPQAKESYEATRLLAMTP